MLTMSRLAAVCVALAVVQVAITLYASFGAARTYPDSVIARYFSADYLERVANYREARRKSALVLVPISEALPILFVFAGPLMWLWRARFIAERHPLLQAALIMAAFVLFTSLGSLPFSYAFSYLRERAFGFSRQTPLGWLADQMKGLGIGVVVASLVTIIFVAIYRWLPRAWPILAAATLSALAIFFTLIFPWVIAPLFHKYRDLPAGELRSRIESLARDQKVAIKKLLVMDASAKTSRTNAYVTGLWGSHRVVLYDTLLEKNTPPEVMSVVAHELGHSVKNHVVIGLVLSIGGIALGVLASWWVLPQLSALLGASAANPAAALPLLLVLGGLIGFFSAPVGSAISRAMESAADRYALEVTHDPEATITMEKKLTQDNLADPNPPRLGQLLFASHPDAIARIQMAENAR